MSKRPQVDFGQQISKRTGGEEEREEIKGGTTTDSLSLLTPTHLLSHWPTQLSPHPGVQRGSANSFLVLFH